jgi:YVTN family beta-propeller protein
MKQRTYGYLMVVLLGVGALLAGCGEQSASGAADHPTPQGRIFTANQGANSLSAIDVATNAAYATVPTGDSPHHVVASPDAKELWVTLYKANHLQVFDAATLKEIGQVDVGGPSDDLAFAPDGKRLYVSMGQDNQLAVIDTAARKLVTKVGVGQTPHGVKVRPDGKEVYVTNTAENTISVITLDGDPKLALSFRVGADPFEVTFDPEGKTAYISNFLGDSLTVVDTATRKITKTVRVGKQPAMLAFVPGGSGQLLWIANTGTQEVWVIDPAAGGKLVTRIPAGGGAHGVVPSPAGKVFVTNTNDNTVTVIDAATQKVLQTVGVGTSPNGLSFVPNP